MGSEATLVGDPAPFVWAYRNSGFCIVTLYDKDIAPLRDDLLFVAKRGGRGAPVAPDGGLRATASFERTAELHQKIVIETRL